MSLEVRQLVLKASVADADDELDGAESGPSGAPAAGKEPGLDPELLKQEILAACRQWWQEALRQQRER